MKVYKLDSNNSDRAGRVTIKMESVEKTSPYKLPKQPCFRCDAKSDRVTACDMQDTINGQQQLYRVLKEKGFPVKDYILFLFLSKKHKWLITSNLAGNIFVTCEERKSENTNSVFKRLRRIIRGKNET